MVCVYMRHEFFRLHSIVRYTQQSSVVPREYLTSLPGFTSPLSNVWEWAPEGCERLAYTVHRWHLADNIIQREPATLVPNKQCRKVFNLKSLPDIGVKQRATTRNVADSPQEDNWGDPVVNRHVCIYVGGHLSCRGCTRCITWHAMPMGIVSYNNCHIADDIPEKVVRCSLQGIKGSWSPWGGWVAVN